MAKDYRGDFCNSQNLMPKELSHSISTSAAVVGCFRPAKARAYLKPSKEEDFCLRNESWQQAETKPPLVHVVVLSSTANVNKVLKK